MHDHENREPTESIVAMLVRRFRRAVTRWRFRASFLGVHFGKVYTLSEDEKDENDKPTGRHRERPRLAKGEGVRLPSILWRKFRHLTPVVSIAIQNCQTEDDFGRRPLLPFAMMKAIYEAGWVVLSEKHALPTALIAVLERTFPDAVSMAAYARGLCAACVSYHTGEKIILKDITSFRRSSDGQIEEVWAGCDGSGRIHPDVLQRWGYSRNATVQWRVWNPDADSLMFLKGILIPDERCLDEAGKPVIWADWLQVKGVRKAWAKKSAGTKTGAFDKDGVLVAPELLKEHCLKLGDNLAVGILHVWDKYAIFRWCYEILERIQMNEESRRYVREFLVESIEDFHQRGGLDGIVDKLIEEDEQVGYIKDFLKVLSDKLGVELSPLQVPTVWDRVQDELQRYHYHLSQGAGKHSDRLVLVMDEGVPEGRCVIGRSMKLNGRLVQPRHGQKVAVTRLPLVLAQGLLVLTNIVVTPESEEWGHLQHMLLKATEGWEVVPWTIFMNPIDVAKMQGDDDGDVTLSSLDPRVIRLFEMALASIPLMPGKLVLIEPAKEPDPSLAIKSLLKTGKVYRDENGVGIDIDDKSLYVLSKDGKGHVGQMTFKISMMLVLKMWMEAAACSCAVQEEIDIGKHDVLRSDPKKVAKLTNWIIDEDSMTPDQSKVRAEEKWTDGTGGINMKEVNKWITRAICERFPEAKAKYTVRRNGQAGLRTVPTTDVLTWKRGSQFPFDDWTIDPDYEYLAKNLVHYSDEVGLALWTAYRGESGWDLPRVDLQDLLSLTLGIPMEPVDNKNVAAYRRTTKPLDDFGRQIKRIMDLKLDKKEKNLQITYHRAIMVDELQALVGTELAAGRDPILMQLRIWVTELAAAKSNRGKEARYTNRAFRAVIWSGSPILSALGVETSVPCSYLDGRIEEYIEVWREGGRKGSLPSRDPLLYGLALWLAEDEHHEMLTGRPLQAEDGEMGCRYCRDRAERVVIMEMRREMQGDDGGTKVKALIAGANAYIKSVTPWEDGEV